MEATRYGLGHHRHVPSFASIIQVLPKSCTFQRIAGPIEDMHVLADPFLDKDCQECCDKTEGKCHEPECVYTDIVTSDADGLNAGKGAGGVEGMETCGAMEASCMEI